MKTYLPNFTKRIGIIFVIVSIILSIIGHLGGNVGGALEAWKNGAEAAKEMSFENANSEEVVTPFFTKNETEIIIWTSLFLSFCGFILYIFAKEKTEDEFIQQIRLKSWVWSIFVCWVITILFMFIGNRDNNIVPEGMYILQLQLFFYVVIYVYNKKWKFA